MCERIGLQDRPAAPRARPCVIACVHHTQEQLSPGPAWCTQRCIATSSRGSCGNGSRQQSLCVRLQSRRSPLASTASSAPHPQSPTQQFDHAIPAWRAAGSGAAAAAAVGAAVVGCAGASSVRPVQFPERVCLRPGRHRHRPAPHTRRRGAGRQGVCLHARPGAPSGTHAVAVLPACYPRRTTTSWAQARAIPGTR